MNDRIVNALTNLVIIAVILAVVLAFSAFKKVDAGERGVKLNFGAVQEDILGEGLHFKIPIYQQIKILDVKTVKYEIQAEAASQDVQVINTTVALNYHLDPANVGRLWQEIGRDYESRIIDPAVQESIKAATARFTAQDLIVKRPELRNAIKEELLKKFEGRHLIVDELSIVNLDFSREYNRAIEQKQVAEQDALRAENDLKKVEFEAAQRVAQAKAEAEAIRIQAEAITSQGGKDYVSLKAIEKWSGNLPTQMIPGSTVPFLNLGL